MPDRWATFDCYGTLIDWNGGIRRELARVFGEERADAHLNRYHEVEPLVGPLLAEDARQLGANAAVPVDQGAVAVEGSPAIRHGQALVLEATNDDRCVVAAEAKRV